MKKFTTYLSDMTFADLAYLWNEYASENGYEQIYDSIEEFAANFETEAEEACDSVGVWSAIRLVRQYEMNNFGETYTGIEPCKIANLLCYISGAFLLAQLQYLQGDTWDRELTEEDLEIIAEQLEQWLELNAPTENDRYTNREIDGQVWDYYGTY